MNSYIYRPAYPNELYHHGISGQKWGVRHGPPYPLKNGFASKVKENGHHTRLEKRMAKKEKRAIKEYNKATEKANATDNARKKVKLEDKARKIQTLVERIAEQGAKYYSLDEKERRKISRGYGIASTLNDVRFVLGSDTVDEWAAKDVAIIERALEKADEKARIKAYRGK